MLKRSTSLITTLCAVLMLVSTVTLLEVRAAGRMHAASYTASENTQVHEFDLGYQEPPAGEADFGPGNYRSRITVVRDTPMAYAELFRDGTLVSAGYVEATHQYESSYASSASMGVAMMATTSTASPSSPSPSSTASPPPPTSPSPTPSSSPSPSPSPSPPTSPSPTPSPGKVWISVGSSGFGIGYDHNGFNVSVEFKKDGVYGKIGATWRF